LENIEEFDVSMVEELQERASDAQLVQALGDSESSDLLMSVEGVSEDLAQVLIEAEITTVENLAELSIDELLDIQKMYKEVASTMIITARENEGWFILDLLERFDKLLIKTLRSSPEISESVALPSMPAFAKIVITSSSVFFSNLESD
jgi:transcription termination factor NusA